MMTPMPKRIKVGALIYRVTAAWDDYGSLGEDPDCYGHTDHKSLTITLNPRLCYGSLAETLWHEIKHAVCRVIGIPDGDALKEEPWVNMTSGMEWTVLRENPELVAFLLEEDDAR
jgi:hypothetical protein